MTNEVILIPCMSRPSWLRATLELLEQYADKDALVVFMFDVGYSQHALSVARSYNHNSTVIEFAPDKYNGNSYVFYKLLKTAALTNAQYAYYIEEDVLIRPDFFLWHRMAQQQCQGIFASVAWPYRIIQGDYVHQDIQIVEDYRAIGVCFPQSTIHMLLGLIELTNPERKDSSFYARQSDSFVKSIMLKSNMRCAFPFLSMKAEHAGWQIQQPDSGQYYYDIKERFAPYFHHQ